MEKMRQSALPFSSARRALSSFGLFRADDRDEKIDAATDLIAKFSLKESDLTDFNPFLAWRPTENDLSDILAKILDPRGAHGLGIASIVAVLRSLNGRIEVSQTVRDRIARLIEVVSSPLEPVQVRREWAVDGARPDIAITIPRKLLVLIEHKRRNGYETDLRGISQSERLWKHLLDWSRKHAVGKDHWLGIILSPDGREAECRDARHDILPLSTFDFGNAINTIFENMIIDKLAVPRGSQHIPTFLDFYMKYEVNFDV